MPVINSIEEVALTAGGGTKNLLTTSGVSLYIITGTATLTSSWTIQHSGIPVIGMTYSFLYKANIDLGISTITIFGETLSTNLADKEFRAESIWNGTAWVTTFLPDVLTPDSIPATAVSDVGNRMIIPIQLSFEANELGKFYINLTDYAPFKLIRGRVETTKTIESTDDATVNTFANDGIKMINRTITGVSLSAIEIPAGHSPNTINISGTVEFNETLTNTSLGGDSVFVFETVKTTPGGKATMYLTVEKV